MLMAILSALQLVWAHPLAYKGAEAAKEAAAKLAAEERAKAAAAENGEADMSATEVCASQVHSLSGYVVWLFMVASACTNFSADLGPAFGVYLTPHVSLH